MMENIFKEETVVCDVLCVGGGIAGPMAAIRAAELGAKVVIAEKGNALHSGRGRSGNDHFGCYIPEVHGADLDEYLKIRNRSAQWRKMQSGTSAKVQRVFMERSYEVVKLWDSWGIPMRYKGKFELGGHAPPGLPVFSLKYEGRMQKQVLIKKAIDNGVKIMNRVMITDLLTDGTNIVGAIGVHTREEKIILFQAKSVVMGTGIVDRLFKPVIPGWLGSVPASITLTGDGRAMAYRAGGKLVGMEVLGRHAGPRYFTRYGQGTWVGVLRDPQGNPIGPFVTQPDKRYGDHTTEANSELLEEYLKSGRGPVYMDCGGLSEEDYQEMLLWLSHEGGDSTINYMREEGIDPRKNPVEFGTYHPILQGRIAVDEKAQTSLSGLYAAGDESTGGIGAAAVFGWIAGEESAGRAKRDACPDSKGVERQVEEKKERIYRIRGQKNGPDWKEANVALQQIMSDYAGLVRSESLLNAGLSYLRRLRKKLDEGMAAKNQWELTRCLETLNLVNLGELVMLAARDRKETRGLHRRPDYPITDLRLDDKALFVRRIDGQPVLEWIVMK